MCKHGEESDCTLVRRLQCVCLVNVLWHIKPCELFNTIIIIIIIIMSCGQHGYP